MSALINFTNGTAPSARVDPYLCKSKKATPTSATSASNSSFTQAAADSDSALLTKSGVAVGHRKRLAEDFEKKVHAAPQCQDTKRRRNSFTKESPTTTTAAETTNTTARFVGRKVTAEAQKLAGRGIDSTLTFSSAAASSENTNNVSSCAATNTNNSKTNADHFTGACISASPSDEVQKNQGIKKMNSAPKFELTETDRDNAYALSKKRLCHVHLVKNATAASSSIGNLISHNNNNKNKNIDENFSVASTSSSVCGTAATAAAVVKVQQQQPQESVSRRKQQQVFGARSYEHNYNILTGSPKKARA